MKLALFFAVALGALVCAFAQFTTEHNPPNLIGEAAMRKIGSRLVIGMPEEAAIQLLETNGLRMHASVQNYTYWSRMCCYSDGSTPYVHALELQFRQRPIPSSLLMATNEQGKSYVLATNGVLYAALLNHVLQIAQTNAP